MKCNYVGKLAATLLGGAMLMCGASTSHAQVSRSLDDSFPAGASGRISDESTIRPTSYLDETAASGGSASGSSAAASSSASRYVPSSYTPSNRNYARGEYLQWWIQGNSTPPLVTTSTPGTARANAGVLGLNSTTVLVGGDALDDGLRFGGRLTLGHWFDDGQMTGIEFSLMGLGGDDTNINFASNGAPILARPFFNQNLNQQDAQLAAFPGVVTADQLSVMTDSEFYSANILLRHNWRTGSHGHIDLIGGYRYARFGEGLLITEDLTVVDPGAGVPVGTTFDIQDRFDASTDFHGGEIGMITEFYHGPVSFSFLTKLAIGGVRQRVVIDGSTTVTQPNTPPVTTDAGLLALPSNSGTFTNNEFALLPELNATATYQVSSCLAITLGYNLLYLTEAVRTGDQIDTTLDLTQIPPNGAAVGPLTRPIANIQSTSLWAQGISVGAELSF
ncbi:MAG: BBP7 family outer membrane beta-barrel protein [Planctomycetales bacterium]|nr:BBP7 family outer membrane beta-barrel protein [Planctomycetales bacterium]